MRSEIESENVFGALCRYNLVAMLAIRHHCWVMACWWLNEHPDLPAGADRWLKWQLIQSFLDDAVAMENESEYAI